MTSPLDRRSQSQNAESQGWQGALRVARQRYDLGSLAPIIFFILLIVGFSVAEPIYFPTTDNLTAILNNGAVLAILTCGLTVVLVVGEFDLSVGAAASFGGALGAVLDAQANWPLGLVILVVLACGILIGLINGILVTKFQIPALIATIGSSSLLIGFSLWITDNRVIFTGYSDPFLVLGRWSLGGLQAPVFYLAICAVVLAILLRYTAMGRHMYATGGNRAASRMSGIRVERQVVMAFVAAGVLSALAGLIYTARQASLTPEFGVVFLLPAFAAAFLGSVTLTRRTFHILGTVLGVYLIETGTVGLLMFGAPAFTQQLFAGAVLILATIGARYRSRGDTS